MRQERDKGSGRLSIGWRRRAVLPHLDGDTRAVLDACPDAVLGIDEDGICVLANVRARGLFARAEADLVGTPAGELLPDLAGAIRELTARRRSGEPMGPTGTGAESLARRPDGTTLSVRVWIAPAYTRGRELTLYVTVHDLSERRAVLAARRALLREVAALRDSVDAVTAAVRDRAIVLTDVEGHITLVNRAAEKLLGYRSEDIVGKPATALSDPYDIDAVREELRLASGVDPLLELTRSGLPNQQRWRMITRDGEVRSVTLVITAIGDHRDPHGFVLVISPRRSEWEPLVKPRASSDRLLLDLDDAETRALRWQVGGASSRRR
ncbi:MAG: PAS domain S-box protein [Kineosporiaceae bacterium]|nr:PAS domain S-box protein [Kineosporiaceae bacterium]